MVADETKEYSEVTPETQEAEEVEMAVVREKRITPHGVFVVFLMIFVAVLVYANIYVQGLFPKQFTQVSNAVNDVAATLGLAKPREKTCEELNKEYKYQSHIEWSGTYKATDKEYWAMRFALEDIDFFSKVAKADEPIQKMQYIPSKNLVVYMTGNRTEGNKIGDELSIHLYDLSVGTDTLILKQNVLSLGDESLKIPSVDRLTDFYVMKDDTSLFITSTNKIWKYDLGTSVLTRIPVRQKDASIGTLFYPRILPDAKTLLIGVGYWESSGYFLLDTETGEFAGVSTLGSELKGYLTMVDWDGSKVIYIRSNYYGDPNQICEFNPETKEINCVLTGDSNPYNITLHENDAYFLLRKTKIGTQEVCNNVNTKYLAGITTTNIEKVASFSGTLQTLVSVDTTDYSGVPQIAEIEKFAFVDIAGKKQIVVHLTDKDEEKFALLDDEHPGAFIEIQ